MCEYVCLCDIHVCQSGALLLDENRHVAGMDLPSAAAASAPQHANDTVAIVANGADDDDDDDHDVAEGPGM